MVGWAEKNEVVGWAAVLLLIHFRNEIFVVQTLKITLLGGSFCSSSDSTHTSPAVGGGAPSLAGVGAKDITVRIEELLNTICFTICKQKSTVEVAWSQKLRLDRVSPISLRQDRPRYPNHLGGFRLLTYPMVF